MKKRIALILLGLILATALFAATSTRFTKYGNIFKSGEFLLKSTTYELDSRGAKVGNPSPVTVAEHAGSYYMEATENGETFKVLIKDGKMNMISDADKSIMVMSMDDMDDSDTIDMPETVDVLSSGNDKLDGKTYYYEKAKAPDGTVSTYWYNGNDLYAIQSVDSIMYINSLTQKPDASLFEVPSGYEVMDMSSLFSMFGDMGTDDYSSSSGDDYDWEAALAGIDWSALLGDSSSWDNWDDYSGDSWTYDSSSDYGWDYDSSPNYYCLGRYLGLTDSQADEFSTAMYAIQYLDWGTLDTYVTNGTYDFKGKKLEDVAYLASYEMTALRKLVEGFKK
jgi:hypothetical protein